VLYKCWLTFHWPLYPKLVPENRNCVTYYRLNLTARVTELFLFVIRHVLHKFPTTSHYTVANSLSCGQEIPFSLSLDMSYTNSPQQGPYPVANSLSCGQEITHILNNANVFYHCQQKPAISHLMVIISLLIFGLCGHLH
jgi:hypothetical protein